MDNDANTTAASGFVDSRLNSFLRALKKRRSKKESAPATSVNRARSATRKQVVLESSAHLGASITFKGDISGQDDLFVTGSIDGSIALQGSDATIEQSGIVGGRIQARQVEIRGTVVGDIEAQEKITISSTGKVEGKIIAPRIAVEDGAFFNGLVDLSSVAAATPHQDRQPARVDPLRSMRGHNSRAAERHKLTGTR